MFFDGNRVIETAEADNFSRTERVEIITRQTIPEPVKVKLTGLPGVEVELKTVRLSDQKLLNQVIATLLDSDIAIDDISKKQGIDLEGYYLRLIKQRSGA